MAWLVSRNIAVKTNLFTPLPFASFCRENELSIRFQPEYSPQLLLAGYDRIPQIVDLIRQYPALFSGFYYWESESVLEKYNKLRELKFSPEHIWDIWDSKNAPIPIRE
ncbi:MAG: hypothetical protein GQ565_03845 [Candidatus Aegiribacteria sp.]|nr:hypothetical protein [Candidatus Aegiribacteria sp.]